MHGVAPRVEARDDDVGAAVRGNQGEEQVAVAREAQAAVAHAEQAAQGVGQKGIVGQGFGHDAVVQAGENELRARAVGQFEPSEGVECGIAALLLLQRGGVEAPADDAEGGVHLDLLRVLLHGGGQFADVFSHGGGQTAVGGVAGADAGEGGRELPQGGGGGLGAAQALDELADAAYVGGELRPGAPGGGGLCRGGLGRGAAFGSGAAGGGGVLAALFGGGGCGLADLLAAVALGVALQAVGDGRELGLHDFVEQGVGALGAPGAQQALEHAVAQQLFERRGAVAVLQRRIEQLRQRGEFQPVGAAPAGVVEGPALRGEAQAHRGQKVGVTDAEQDVFRRAAGGQLQGLFRHARLFGDDVNVLVAQRNDAAEPGLRRLAEGVEALALLLGRVHPALDGEALARELREQGSLAGADLREAGEDEGVGARGKLGRAEAAGEAFALAEAMPAVQALFDAGGEVGELLPALFLLGVEGGDALAELPAREFVLGLAAPQSLGLAAEQGGDLGRIDELAGEEVAEAVQALGEADAPGVAAGRVVSRRGALGAEQVEGFGDVRLLQLGLPGGLGHQSIGDGGIGGVQQLLHLHDARAEQGPARCPGGEGFAEASAAFARRDDHDAAAEGTGVLPVQVQQAFGNEFKGRAMPAEKDALGCSHGEG